MMHHLTERPRIGVTTSARSGWRIFPLIALSVRLAGGKPIWWRVGAEADIGSVDGLIVGGGDDISADLYGGKIIQETRIDPARDALERRLVREAIDTGRPVLGICRGAQMINVTLGGTLYQNIYDVYASARNMWTVLPRKEIEIVPGGLLARTIGEEPASVNALHTQSVHQLGAGLRVAARDSAGVVQAVERDAGGPTGDSSFVLGVQWHPEHLFYARRQRAIFRGLVAAARAYRRGDEQIDAVLAEAA